MFGNAEGEYMKDGLPWTCCVSLRTMPESTSTILQSALDAFKGPAAGAQPKDIYQAHYWEMAGAHAMLINGLLSVYEVTIWKSDSQIFCTHNLLYSKPQRYRKGSKPTLFFTSSSGAQQWTTITSMCMVS